MSFLVLKTVRLSYSSPVHSKILLTLQKLSCIGTNEIARIFLGYWILIWVKIERARLKNHNKGWNKGPKLTIKSAPTMMVRRKEDLANAILKCSQQPTHHNRAVVLRCTGHLRPVTKNQDKISDWKHWTKIVIFYTFKFSDLARGMQIVFLNSVKISFVY